MSQRFYPAVLERDEGGAHGLWFPDFPGAVAGGVTQEDAMARAQDVLARAMEARAEEGEALPQPTPVEQIAIPADCSFIAFVAVGASPPDPAERINVYLSRSLLARADRAAADWGMSRSGLIGLALRRLIDGPMSLPFTRSR